MKKKKLFAFLKSKKTDKKINLPIKRALSSAESKIKIGAPIGHSKELAKKCDTVSKTAIYILVFLLPLFFLPWTANILDFSKQALLIVLVFISLFAWIIRSLVLGKISLNLSKIHIPVLVFLAVVFLSTIFSSWTYGSFWGWPLINSESLLSLVCLTLLYLLITNIFKKKEVFYLITALVFSGFLASLLGVFQMFGKFLIPMAITKAASFNTVGSVNKLGLLSVVILSLIIGLLIVSKKGFLRFILAIALILSTFLLVLVNFSIIWWTVIVAAGLIMAFGMQKTNFFDNRFLILPMFFLAIALFFIFFQFQIPGLPARSVEVFLTQKTSFNVALYSLKEKPIFGSGPGTFIYGFSKYKDVGFNANPFWNVRFDSAKSKVTNILATMGSLGILSFLAMIGMFIFYGARFLFKGPVFSENDLVKQGLDQKSLWALSAGIFMGFVALSFSFFFYSSNLTLEFVFFLLMASLAVLISPPRRDFLLKPSSLFTLVITFVFTIVFILGLGLFILEGQRYLAEVYYLRGIKAGQLGQTDTALNYLEKAAKINPKTDLYWRELSQIYIAKIGDEIARTDISQDEINQRVQFLINNTVNSSKGATDINPNNVANWSIRGFAYQSLVGVVGGVKDWAKSSYEEALKLEPTNPYYPTQIGITLLKDVNFMSEERKKEREMAITEARGYFESALELKPDYSPAHFQLAMTYQAEGKIEEAANQLEKIKAIAPQDVGLAFQLGLLYYQNGNYKLAEVELERAVTINPSYANALYFLGLTYEKRGKVLASIEKFERLAELNPGNNQIQIILSNLRSGKSILKGIVEEIPPQVPIEEE